MQKINFLNEVRPQELAELLETTAERLDYSYFKDERGQMYRHDNQLKIDEETTLDEIVRLCEDDVYQRWLDVDQIDRSPENQAYLAYLQSELDLLANYLKETTR